MSLPFPEFGEPLPAGDDPRLLELLARRRSSSPQLLVGPGPTAAQLDDLLNLAARVPDHGKLAPWRFVVISGESKPPLLEQLRVAAARQPDPDSAGAKLAKLGAAPLTILVISRPTPGHKVPEWEQVLSAGAVCMTLLVAADAMGFGGSWITDWYAYDPEALDLLGVRAGERVAGFIHIGHAPEPPLERPRPDLSALVSHWPG